MTKRAKKPERRQHLRLENKLPLKIAANGYDFITSTQNISCLGAYCTITKYVPPFTKIAIKLSLPILQKEKKYCDVECKGVIVRTEDEINGKGFNIAVFFNDIKSSQRHKITRYITQWLPKNPSV